MRGRELPATSVFSVVFNGRRPDQFVDGDSVLILVMGVAGSGKTLIGSKLAEALHCVFADADSFHPAANIEKMSKGIALNDEDRQPWLDAISKALCGWQTAGQDAVVTCSALKERYRK